MTLVKICGLMRPEDVDAAVEAGADLVGFILVEGTPRYLEPDRARALAARVPSRVRTVAVTVAGWGQVRHLSTGSIWCRPMTCRTSFVT